MFSVHWKPSGETTPISYMFAVINLNFTSEQLAYLGFKVRLCSKKTFEGVLDRLEKRMLDFLRFLEAF
jgi:hypothetical protein